VERLDEADLERWCLCRGAQADARDDGLSQDEATDFLCGGSECMVSSKGDRRRLILICL